MNQQQRQQVLHAAQTALHSSICYSPADLFSSSKHGHDQAPLPINRNGTRVLYSIKDCRQELDHISLLVTITSLLTCLNPTATPPFSLSAFPQSLYPQQEGAISLIGVVISCHANTIKGKLSTTKAHYIQLPMYSAQHALYSSGSDLRRPCGVDRTHLKGRLVAKPLTFGRTVKDQQY